MTRPTLAQIEAFIRIAEAGTFVRAAEQLHITQPTISQRIREFENAVGAPLFVRRGPRTALTPGGSALLPTARRVLAASTALEHQLRNVDALKGTLRLGMTDTFARVCLVDLLRELSNDYPDLEASVLVGDSPSMERMLEEGTLDIAVLVEAAPRRGVRLENAGLNEITWLANPGLRLPRRVTPKNLVEMHIIVPSAVSKVHSTVQDWFSAAGLSPSRLSTCSSVTVMMQAVMAGLAITVQPVRIMSEAIRRGHLKRLDARPSLPAHRVSIGYQTQTLGPRVAEIVARQHALILRHRLFRK